MLEARNSLGFVALGRQCGIAVEVFSVMSHDILFSPHIRLGLRVLGNKVGSVLNLMQ